MAAKIVFLSPKDGKTGKSERRRRRKWEV